MPPRRKSLSFCAIPFAIVACVTLFLWHLGARQRTQGRTLRSPDRTISSIRQASAEAPTKPSWKPAERILSDPVEQWEHAQSLCSAARYDPSLYPSVQKELRLALEGLPVSSPEAEKALYTMARSLGLWGEGKAQESLAAYTDFLARFPESELRSRVYYEMGRTYDVSLKNPSSANECYRKAAALAPDQLSGLMASSRLNARSPSQAAQ